MQAAEMAPKTDERWEQGVSVWAITYGFPDEVDWVAARSLSEALRYWLGLFGEHEFDDDPEIHVRQVESLEKKVTDMDAIERYDDNGKPVYRQVTLRELIREALAEGGAIPGVIASSVY